MTSERLEDALKEVIFTAGNYDDPVGTLLRGLTDLAPRLSIPMSFDEACARWVQRYLRRTRNLDTNPIIGSVEFSGSYDEETDELYPVVRWQEPGNPINRTKTASNRQCTVEDIVLQDLIREVAEIMSGI